MSYPGGTPRLVDPYTLDDFVPAFVVFAGSGPVESRHATPEELEVAARPVRSRTSIRLLPGPRSGKPKRYIVHLSDDEVLGAVARSTTLDEAAAHLNTSQASLSRRLRQIREAVTR